MKEYSTTKVVYGSNIVVITCFMGEDHAMTEYSTTKVVYGSTIVVITCFMGKVML